MLLDFLPLPRSLMTAPKCMGCSVGKTANLSLFPIPYSLSTACEIPFSFLPTHLKVLFKAFDERYCQTHSEKTRSLYQQALPCPLDDPLLQRIHKSWGPTTSTTLPHCGLYVLVFVYEIFHIFFHDVYNPVSYRYQAAGSVVTQTSSKDRPPSKGHSTHDQKKTLYTIMHLP